MSRNNDLFLHCGIYKNCGSMRLRDPIVICYYTKMELDILQALSHKGIIMSEPNCMLLLKYVLSRRLF